MKTKWALYWRCATCKTGERYIPGESVLEDVIAADEESCICEKCGGLGWESPRPGRIIPWMWWKPWTWGRTIWEWRDDYVITPEAPSKGHANLLLLPGGKDDQGMT